MRKLWYIYTMEYYSAVKKNTFESVLMRWMKLEPIIQREVSQKEKHQYSIIIHIDTETNGTESRAKINPSIYSHLIFDKGAKEKTVIQ